MPDISSLSHGPIGPLDRPHAPRARETAEGVLPDAPSRRGADSRDLDSVELSEHARLLDQIRRLPEGRLDRVESIRAQIASGTYETDDKLTEAVTRMLDDLL